MNIKFFLQCFKKYNIRYFDPFRLTDPIRRWQIDWFRMLLLLLMLVTATTAVYQPGKEEWLKNRSTQKP